MFDKYNSWHLALLLIDGKNFTGAKDLYVSLFKVTKGDSGITLYTRMSVFGKLI